MDYTHPTQYRQMKDSLPRRYLSGGVYQTFSAIQREIHVDCKKTFKEHISVSFEPIIYSLFMSLDFQLWEDPQRQHNLIIASINRKIEKSSLDNPISVI